jgi:subfamily B ATP-binding cassette protein MsbA
MAFIKKLIKKYFVHLSYFYRHIGHRLTYGLLITILVGTLDGLGLSMFLPLFQMTDGSAVASAEEMGNLAFVTKGISKLGLKLNLITICSVMLIFFILKGIAKFVEGYYRVIVQQYFIKKLRLSNIRLFSQYDYELYITADAGRIQNTLSGEIQRVVQAYRYYFQSLQAMVLLLVYIILAFLSNPQFAFFVTIGGLLSNLAFNRLYKLTKETSRKITNIGHVYQGLLMQKINFFKYLKATGFGRSFENKLASEIKLMEKNNLKIGYYNALLNSIREPVVISVVIVLIVIQVNFLGQSMGLIILALLFFYRALNSIIQVQSHWNNFLNVSGSLENMTQFQEELKRGKEVQGNVEFKKFNNSIEFRKMFFWYAENKIILNDINITIKKNETIAFVGESGSGKTTLVNLIAGLMKAKKGDILIDDINYRELNRISLQRKIGYITQEPVIFNDTIYNNITLWRNTDSEVDIEKFKYTISFSALESFINSTPERENTMLGNNGINLSGGQRQRISIARELFKDVEILIMDEATSALDSETERTVQDAIESLKGRYTILVVAHRLSTVRNADRIVYMKNGEIQAIDTFDNLFETNERFRSMAKLQEF